MRTHLNHPPRTISKQHKREQRLPATPSQPLRAHPQPPHFVAQCKTVKCGRACCKPPAHSTPFCSAGKCAWKCKAGYIPCNGKCELAAPIKNSVGWCSDGKTYKWACASFHTLCRAACVPYPSGAVNIVCDQLRGTITFQCGMNWVNCFNKYCCEPPLYAIPLCLVNAQLQPVCDFVCKAGYKKCNSNKSCCKK
jgi:hypothetical protein